MANIIDSYSETNQNSFYFLDTNVPRSGVAQSFTGNGSSIGSAVFYLAKSGAPTGNAVAKVYTHSGTFGTSSVPTGAALATSDNFNVATLTTTLALATLNFSGANQISLTNATKYVISIEYSGGDGSNHLEVGVDTSSPTHAGNDADFISSWTAHSGEDMIFYVYDNAGGTTTSTSISTSSTSSSSTSSSTSISTSSTSASTSTSTSISTSSTSTSTTQSVTTSTSSTSSSISTSSTSSSTSLSTSSTSSSTSISTSSTSRSTSTSISTSSTSQSTSTSFSTSSTSSSTSASFSTSSTSSSTSISTSSTSSSTSKSTSTSSTSSSISTSSSTSTSSTSSSTSSTSSSTSTTTLFDDINVRLSVRIDSGQPIMRPMKRRLR